jgi:hypothetical protein
MVILGGGVGSRRLLIDLVRRWLRRLGHGTIDVRQSELGPRATMVGAVELARDVARVGREHESVT